MERAATPSLNPAFLPPGTRIGPWRVVEWVGSGVYGAVYRAVREGDEQGLPVALKLALYPGDPRFVREAELLSRQRHPHLPKWVDQGTWERAGGALHPYVIMEWIDGVPLYDWARTFHPSEAQVLRLLAQVALALQVLHAQGAVHRDVKGGNILVRRSDSRAFLMDLGTGLYPGADPLTPPALLPGTPAYRSPEAWLFSVQHGRKAPAACSAGPADDLYALGVTACVLVTGHYPEPWEAEKDEQGVWQLKSMVLPRALLRGKRVTPAVREVILRLLSVNDEERGTAWQCAQEMERTAASLAAAWAPTGASLRSVLRGSARPWWPWLGAAAVAGVLGLWAVWAYGTSGDSTRVARSKGASARPENAEPVGLGDTAASTATETAPRASGAEMMAADSLPEPLPGQVRPNAKGQCPRANQIVLNEACWVETSLEHEKCDALSGRVYKGLCYVPIIPPGRPVTTTPTEQP